MSIKNLSVFFPIYNEEGNVEITVKKATEVLKNLDLNYEIIIVNDGSNDKTGEIAEDLAKKDPHIRIIHHQKNSGYGEALKSGFYNAKYETICYTDGDGQFDFNEVSKFLEKIEDHDLVLGYRIKRQDPLFRILFKKGWKLSLLTFFGLKFKDVDCGFKMIRKEVLEKIPHLESSRGAMINAELAIKTKKSGFKIAQVGVNHYPRLSGKPTGASINVILKSYTDLIRLWWKLKDEKWAFLILLGILLIASFFRLYKIDQYMIFLGDEGRDSIIVKKMIEEYHFPLIGPPTSVGNIYLGPLYYYMMLTPMFIFNFNPISASVMVAIIGVISVWLIYYLGKVWFGNTSGLVASFLYAISPVTINYSNFSWNPNPLPFFALLSIYGFYKAYKSGNFLWLILSGLSVAAAVQMHYLALILIPVMGILWIHQIRIRFRRKYQTKNLIKGTILGILSFLLLMSPLLWFDLRHDFLNYKAVSQFLSEGSTLNWDIFGNIIRLPEIYSQALIGRYMAGENFYIALVLSGLIILSLFRKSWPVFCLGVWLGVGLFGLSFYQGDIFDHYLGFLNPAPFLLFGSLASIHKSMNKRWILGGFLIVTTILTIVNLQKNPLRIPPNNQLKKTEDIARYIISKAENEPFNFALIAKNNYDSAYQFYLDICGYKPKQVPFYITNQLFVVCEDQICEPINHPKQEISHFGWSKIEWEEEAYGVKIFKLVHNPSGKP